MFFKFGLNLINVVLRYQSRLGVNLLKYDAKRGKFAKSEAFPYTNLVIVVGTGYNICKRGLYFSNPTGEQGAGNDHTFVHGSHGDRIGRLDAFSPSDGKLYILAEHAGQT